MQWVAAGLGGIETDALLEVHVAADGAMSFDVIALNEIELMPLEEYDVAFWKEHFKGR